MTLNSIEVLLESELIAEKILGYLDAKSLAYFGSCCLKLRNLANSNKLWYKLCLRKKYDKYEYLVKLPSHPAITTKTNSVSPIFHAIKSNIKTELCFWRDVYNRANHLEKNWSHGIYFVAPVLKGHKGCVSAFDTNGSIIVSGGKDDKYIKVWSVEDLECLNTIKIKSDSINCLKLYNDFIISAGDEGVIKFFDFDGELKKSISTSAGSASHMIIVKDYLAICFNDKTLRVFSIKDFSLLNVLRGHNDEIECVKSSISYENIILTGSWDNKIILWDIENGTRLKELEGHLEVINSLKMHNDCVVSASSDSTLIMWNLKIEKKLSNSSRNSYKYVVELNDTRSLSGGHQSDVYCVDVNDDYVVSGGADSLVVIWSFQTGDLVHKLSGHLGIVRFVFINENQLVTGGDSKKIIVWDYKNGKMLNTLHRNPTKFNFMYLDDTKIITASPEAESNLTLILYW